MHIRPYLPIALAASVLLLACGGNAKKRCRS